MILKLNNDIELEVIYINGLSKYFQNANRDCLEIHIEKGAKTFEELDTLFASMDNTKKITVIDDAGTYVHDNYSLRMNMELRPVQTQAATSTAPAVTEDRIVITLAQKTYIEVQLDDALAGKAS